jgi:hypothetical protein
MPFATMSINCGGYHPCDELSSTYDTGVQTPRVLDKRGLSILVQPEYRESAAKVRLQSPHQLIDFLTLWPERFA